MKSDNYDRQILTESDICELYLTDPERILKNVLIESDILFNDSLELKSIPELKKYQESTLSVTEFDKNLQSNWYMPEEYINLDIAKWVLDQCKEDYELQRVGEELIKFQEYQLFPLLCYCKYLVDTMRKNNVVWGVGRGSSVSSYVLYLIGIHRINSCYYDLSIDEFLK